MISLLRGVAGNFERSLETSTLRARLNASLNKIAIFSLTCYAGYIFLYHPRKTQLTFDSGRQKALLLK